MNGLIFIMIYAIYSLFSVMVGVFIAEIITIVIMYTNMRIVNNEKRKRKYREKMNEL